MASAAGGHGRVSPMYRVSTRARSSSATGVPAGGAEVFAAAGAISLFFYCFSHCFSHIFIDFHRLSAAVADIGPPRGLLRCNFC